LAITFNVSPVDVANEALGQLGKDFLTDLDDTADPVAVKAKQYFGSLLRTMLRDHIWNFAKFRVELVASAAAPISDWTYQYPLPADCFRVVRVNNSDRSIWELEGRNLMSDESSVIIQGIKWEIDPNIWDGAFYQAFVTYLAVRFAPAFHTDVAKSSDLYKLYQMQLLDAKAVDGQEGSQEQMTATELTDDIREE